MEFLKSNSTPHLDFPQKEKMSLIKKLSKPDIDLVRASSVFGSLSRLVEECKTYIC